jgi:hypothetical protein
LGWLSLASCYSRVRTRLTRCNRRLSLSGSWPLGRNRRWCLGAVLSAVPSVAGTVAHYFEVIPGRRDAAVFFGLSNGASVTLQCVGIVSCYDISVLSSVRCRSVSNFNSAALVCLTGSQCCQNAVIASARIIVDFVLRLGPVLS